MANCKNNEIVFEYELYINLNSLKLNNIRNPTSRTVKNCENHETVSDRSSTQKIINHIRMSKTKKVNL